MGRVTGFLKLTSDQDGGVILLIDKNRLRDCAKELRHGILGGSGGRFGADSSPKVAGRWRISLRLDWVWGKDWEILRDGSGTGELRVVKTGYIDLLEMAI